MRVSRVNSRLRLVRVFARSDRAHFSIMNESALRECFQSIYGRVPQVIARAPGRIEFIGNHTDYNGGDVLGAAIDRFVWVAATANRDRRMRFLLPIPAHISPVGPRSAAGVL